MDRSYSSILTGDTKTCSAQNAFRNFEIVWVRDSREERRMKREYIADFDIPKSGKIHGQSVMPKQELIRCKDCKYYDSYYCHNKWWGDGYGNYPPPIKEDDGYCDWAERREEWQKIKE